MQLLIKFPSRERPDKVISCVEKYMKLADTPDLLNFLFSFDEDDVTTNNDEFISKINLLCRGRNQIIFGKSESKVHAINRDMEHARQAWDILMLASDDMIPIKSGYDTIIKQDMQDHFPDTDGVLWYVDGFRDDIITLSIMGKQYYQRYNYIYHPSYKSFYCDNEFTEVCFNRVYKSDIVLITHEHPDNVRGVYDNLYKKNSKFSHHDEKNFFTRKQNNWK